MKLTECQKDLLDFDKRTRPQRRYKTLRSRRIARQAIELLQDKKRLAQSLEL